MNNIIKNIKEKTILSKKVLNDLFFKTKLNEREESNFILNNCVFLPFNDINNVFKSNNPDFVSLTLKYIFDYYVEKEYNSFLTNSIWFFRLKPLFVDIIPLLIILNNQKKINNFNINNLSSLLNLDYIHGIYSDLSQNKCVPDEYYNILENYLYSLPGYNEYTLNPKANTAKEAFGYSALPFNKIFNFINDFFIKQNTLIYKDNQYPYINSVHNFIIFEKQKICYLDFNIQLIDLFRDYKELHISRFLYAYNHKIETSNVVLGNHQINLLSDFFINKRNFININSMLEGVLIKSDIDKLKYISLELNKIKEKFLLEKETIQFTSEVRKRKVL